MTIQNINFAQYAGKTDGTSTLSANEWNTIMSDLDTVVDAIPESSSQSAGGSDSGVVSVEDDSVDSNKKIVKINNVTVGELTVKTGKGTNVALSGDNNINIEPRPAIGTGEGKNNTNDANRKGGNISLKPGDDIEFCSHKRGTGKNTEIAVKAIDGNDNPVKLQVFAGDITLTTKGKGDTKVKDNNGDDIKTPYRTITGYTGGKDLPVVLSNGHYYLASANDKNATATDTEVASEYVASSALYDDPNVMNVNVTTGDGKGYLKVRAQAIDLRCEDHGGIALQPKGQDAQGHENKIKFEHGGGDGLEFGTFNTEKTSIFTNEYRFNKDGVWKMATRTTEASDKAEVDDTTTTRKYVKQSDDFYDIISENDQTATTKDIINAGNVARELKNNGREGYIILVLTEDNDFAAGSIFYNCSNLPPYEGSYKITDLATNVLGGSYAQAFIDRIADMDFDDPSDNTVWFTTDAPGSDSNLHAFKVYQQKEISAADNRAAMINSNNLFIKNGTNACKLDDVLSVVTWMKANNQGPWANA